jgi:hypothetical protein
MRRVRAAAVVVLLLQCGCGGGPTSPGGGSGAQAVLNSASPELTVNGVTVAPNVTTNVTVGSTVAFQVNYTNNSGQTLHTGISVLRDDGVERLVNCGASGSGGGGGGFGSGWTIFANDPFYTPGRSMRVLLLAALGSGPTAPGECLLGSIASGQVNRAAVQAERLLATLAIQ